MVLRDSFMASDKVKIIMLTCICPGMSSANHTLNSLRYAERLKEKAQGGQGQSKGLKGMSADQVTDELRLFLERHGKQLKEKPINASAEQHEKVQERMN
jgi:kinesin family protein 2/24